MNDILMGLFCLVILVTVVPVLVYLCVKLGTFAFYRGRQRFLDQQNKEIKRHGNE